MRSVFISCISLFVSLFFVELGVRFINTTQPSQRFSDRPDFFYKAPQAKLFKDFPEMFAGTSSPRVAVVGDSFTFATSMQFDDAFPRKLERLMHAEGYSNAAVVNYGVPGYSTAHERSAVVDAVRDGAEILILQVTLNDPQRKSYRPSGLTGLNQFGPLVLEGRELRLARIWNTYEFIRTRIHNTKTLDHYISYYHDLFFNKVTWVPFKNAVTDIVRFCDDHEVPLLVVVFPLFGTELDADYPFHRLHERVGNLFARKNIPVLDLYSLYEGIPLERIQVEPGIDFHPNEYGHRLAAEAIYEWMVYERGVLAPVS